MGRPSPASAGPLRAPLWRISLMTPFAAAPRVSSCWVEEIQKLLGCEWVQRFASAVWRYGLEHPLVL